MKKAIAFFLLAVSLSACASPPGSVGYNCGQHICTTAQVTAPVRRERPTAPATPPS